MQGAEPWNEPADVAPVPADYAPAPEIRSLLGTTPAGVPRQHRRLPERILVAAHQACDLGDLTVAASLLSILEVVLLQPNATSSGSYRRSMEGLVAAYERLWHLRRATGAATGDAVTAANRD